jgi:hypothetical protein
MKNILLYIWQLPQNILGLLVVLITRAKHEPDLGFYCTYKFGWFGVSLGNYIIFGGSPSKRSINHEKGHQKQSRYLGWLYLILIGIPSFFGNIWDRLVHKKWPVERQITWYYSQPWEKWADILGGVER